MNLKNISLSVVAVLSAPVIYGFICVPLVGVVMSLFPALHNDLGGTYHVGLTLGFEALQLSILIICGLAVAAIAPDRPRLHATVSVLLMLVIGVSVQLSFWDAMLVWHHFVFFMCIGAGMLMGASLLPTLRGGADTNVTA